jgi:hypothetical protein
MEEKELHQRMYPEAAAKPEYIICAAIHFDDGLKHPHQPVNISSGYVICGRRHHNVYVTFSILAFGEPKKEFKQGFLTSKDRFVSRKEAGEIALAAKQITEPNNCLFSEDLY